MTSACFSRGHTGFSRNATLVATVNPPALAGGVFNFSAYVYVYLSIIFYIFIICMYLNCKKYIEKAICNDGKNIIDIISNLKKNDTYILMIATMMAVSSIGMFVLLSEIIF